MPNLKRHNKDRYLVDEMQTAKGYVFVESFAAPAAPGNTDIHAAIAQPASSTTVVTTSITNPDMPRVVRIKGNQSTCTGNVVVAGTDRRGATISDTIAASGTSAVDGVKAFKTVTSITIPTQGASGDTISLGFGKALGLSRAMPADLGLQGTADGTLEATKPLFAASSSAICSNTVSFNTATNGAKNFKAAYISTELYAGV